MPLSERARIEIYLPDRADYIQFHEWLVSEFTSTFGGCTEAPGLSGHYISSSQEQVDDSITLVYVDTSLRFDSTVDDVAAYTDMLRETAFQELQEEVIYLAAYKVQISAGADVHRNS